MRCKADMGEKSVRQIKPLSSLAGGRTICLERMLRSPWAHNGAWTLLNNKATTMVKRMMLRMVLTKMR